MVLSGLMKAEASADAPGDNPETRPVSQTVDPENLCKSSDTVVDAGANESSVPDAIDGLES